MGSNVSDQAGQVRHVLDGIRRIVQGLRESSRDTERRTHLTSAQIFVLHCLAEADSLSVNDLAARTFTHQSSVSVVASRLVAGGLVKRRADPQDGRRRILTLTAQGRRALAGAPPAAQERLIAAVLGMTPAVRRSVGRALETMANAILAHRHPAMFFEERGRA